MTKLPIPLPEGFEPKVSKNEEIKEDQVLAEKRDSDSDVVIKLSQILGISPKKAKKLLKKTPGDLIRTNDIVAQKPGIIKKTTITSKIEGVFYRFDEENGDILIRIHPGEEDGKIVSPVDGKVLDVTGDLINLEIDREMILGEEGYGLIVSGDLIVSGSAEPDASDVDSSVLGKIFAAKKFHKETMAKALGLGSLGIIGVEIPESEVKSLLGKKINNPIIKIKDADFDNFIKNSKKVIIDGQKKIIVKLL